MHNQNHRSCPRWKVNAQVKVKIGDSLTPVPATIIDINFKGAKLLMRQLLKPDSSIPLFVILPDDSSLNLEVWIAWHKNFENQHIYGVYFNKIKEEDKQKISDFFRGSSGKNPNDVWGNGNRILREEVNKMNDRRIFERFPARFSMDLLCEGDMRQRRAETFDISAKGIGLVAEQALPAMTPLEMWLTLPDNQEPFYTRGKVVWSMMRLDNRCVAGVELEKADLMGVSRILRAI